ncbi:MAG: hypothetical protein ABIO99_02075 [Candidatus Limnocylindria bacterium]
MSRRSILTIAATALLAALIPAAALAAPPEGYRVIDYRHADGGSSSVDGCIGTDVYFGSTDAVYGGRPGRINKQAGPTDVLVIVSDLCGEPVGKGFPLIALWQGQAMIGLQSNAQLTTASVDAWIPVMDDVSGARDTAHLVVTWTATGRAIKDPTHIHNRIPGVAVVNSHDNDTMVDAVASGSVTIGAWSADISTDAAHLSSVKAGCQVILHPGVEDADIDCV